MGKIIVNLIDVSKSVEEIDPRDKYFMEMGHFLSMLVAIKEDLGLDSIKVTIKREQGIYEIEADESASDLAKIVEKELKALRIRHVISRR